VKRIEAIVRRETLEALKEVRAGDEGENAI